MVEAKINFRHSLSGLKVNVKRIKIYSIVDQKNPNQKPKQNKTPNKTMYVFNSNEKLLLAITGWLLFLFKVPENYGWWSFNKWDSSN